MLEFPDNSFRAAIIVIRGNGRHSYNERKQREYQQKKNYEIEQNGNFTNEKTISEVKKCWMCLTAQWICKTEKKQ